MADSDDARLQALPSNLSGASLRRLAVDSGIKSETVDKEFKIWSSARSNGKAYQGSAGFLLWLERKTGVTIDCGSTASPKDVGATPEHAEQRKTTVVWDPNGGGVRRG